MVTTLITERNQPEAKCHLKTQPNKVENSHWDKLAYIPLFPQCILERIFNVHSTGYLLY